MAPRTGRSGAVPLVVAGMLAQQFGAAVASLLMPRTGAAGVVCLRLTIAALVLGAVCRPSVRGRTCTDWAVTAAFGIALVAMNLSFYEAVARMPLGAVVTIEVLGPLLLSVLASRKPSGWLWALLAFAGVALLGRDGTGSLTPAGTAFALGAAVMWAAYILLSQRVGGRFAGLDGLAVAMAVAALISLPIGLGTAGTVLVEPSVLALGTAVALLSSVLPSGLELVSLRRVRAATFAILMSLAPALAATAGYLVLGQPLTLVTALAIGLVVIASAGAVRRTTDR